MQQSGARTFKLSPGENLYVPFPLLINLYFSLVGASLLACTHPGSGKDRQEKQLPNICTDAAAC